MSKKDFIALADAIRNHNLRCKSTGEASFTESHLSTLADFCRSQNPHFMYGRWADYIEGKCGPNGGKVKV